MIDCIFLVILFIFKLRYPRGKSVNVNDPVINFGIFNPYLLNWPFFYIISPHKKVEKYNFLINKGLSSLVIDSTNLLL